MKKTLLLCITICIALMVWATAPMGKVFTTKYGIKPTSKLAAAKCGVCHVGSKGGKLNPYGIALKTKMGKSKKLTPAILSAVEKLDSDKDGKSNLAEIKGDSNPGKD